MSIYNLLADLVVVIHVACVIFNVFGLLAVLVGRLLRWKWVRNFWFRTIHLMMIAFLVVQVLGDIACPLTTLEKHFMFKAGLEPYPRSFVGECLHNLIFFDAEPWMFTVCYCGFGAAVLATFFLVPPRWPRWRRKPEPERASDHGSAG